MEICPQCDNFFSLKEDPDKRTLQHECKDCGINQDLTDYCISTTTYKDPIRGAEKFNYAYAYSDPTLPRKEEAVCKKCGKKNLPYVRRTNLSIILLCDNPDCKHVDF